MQKIISILFLFFSILTYGQNVNTLKPILGNENNYSKTEFKYWRSAIDSLVLSDNSKNEINYFEMTKRTKKAIDSLEMGHGPKTQGIGCSWYCGGGPYKISSSSILKKNINYSDQNIHDFDLLTAWVPKSKNGIGESISFHFKANSPRINTIEIYNGYVKTKKLWKNNSRAKKLKLKIDNKTIAILELEDTTASQRFEIQPIQSTIENQDLVLTLEILESYEGEKYSDLVISEINFDGIDVH
ncbi:hypothetical protein D1816_02520 [Aquimarina sp. AD10]|uniref:NADase-type glycan-binding domain-containing protein n=1 Tax=Aquimarina sp. AD10 TaxID=1714849 RepID=UPI000E49A381|nr:hypothetical protein [Aquimarina sp. AD10]AXT59267.1 hypothetical protein D1816_02520 [Aquimarina sp. AD10]RKM92447.1 hypothetical protein D7033_21000 [Aquimarina sp. AD10]